MDILFIFFGINLYLAPVPFGGNAMDKGILNHGLYDHVRYTVRFNGVRNVNFIFQTVSESFLLNIKVFIDIIDLGSNGVQFIVLL